MDELVVAGADANLRDVTDGESALHAAVLKGHAGIVEALVDCGADVNLREYNFGRTALHLAVTFGHVEMVQSVRTNHKIN